MVARGTPCLGPVTQAGCGAICPAFGRGCYGCFGPVAAPNLPALGAQLRRHGMTDKDVRRVFATFNAASPALANVRVLRPGDQGTPSLTEPAPPPDA
jgi:sulfhydrogenase subunit delta